MKALSLLILASTLAGCGGPVVTETDNRQVQREFSQGNYEQQMRKLGREKELEEEKARMEARAREEEQPPVAPPAQPDNGPTSEGGSGRPAERSTEPPDK